MENSLIEAAYSYSNKLLYGIKGICIDKFLEVYSDYLKSNLCDGKGTKLETKYQ